MKALDKEALTQFFYFFIHIYKKRPFSTAMKAFAHAAESSQKAVPNLN